MPELTASIDALQRRGVAWSIRAAPIDAPAEPIFVRDEDRVLPTASAAKILVLMAAASAMESGELGPDDTLSRSTVTPVADSGIWQFLDVDALPASGVAHLVGAASDNWATNVLIARLGGVERVQGMAADLTIPGVALHDIVRDVRASAHPATLNSGSARGYADLLVRLWTDTDLHPAVAARVRSWLRDGLDLSMVGSAFGLDPLAHHDPDRGYGFFNKTGTDLGTRVDVGVVTGPARTLVYAAIARWDEEADPALRDDILAAMRLFGHTLRAHVG